MRRDRGTLSISMEDDRGSVESARSPPGGPNRVGSGGNRPGSVDRRRGADRLRCHEPKQASSQEGQPRGAPGELSSSQGPEPRGEEERLVSSRGVLALRSAGPDPSEPPPVATRRSPEDIRASKSPRCCVDRAPSSRASFGGRGCGAGLHPDRASSGACSLLKVHSGRRSSPEHDSRRPPTPERTKP